MKKKKLDSIPKINRRLFKLWSETVRNRANNKCEYCGIEKGDLNTNDKKTKIDAHHFLSRDIHNCPLKFEILNGISVCPFHHKFGIPSFHRDPITTITWLIKKYPERYNFVLNNSNIRVDLQNREILQEIENNLKEGKSLDIKKLVKIDKTEKKRNNATLFDKDPQSSSSSSS